MTTLIAARQAIVDTIATSVPAFKAVGAHPSVMTAANVARCAKSTPSCWVTCLGWPRTALVAGGRKVFPMALWAAYILTKDVAAVVGPPAVSMIPRGDQALILANELTNIVPLGGTIIGPRWGTQDFGPAENVAAGNLHHEAIDKAGLALWSVTWRQPVELDPIVAGGALEDFNEYRAYWTLNPYQHPDPDVVDAEDIDTNLQS